MPSNKPSHSCIWRMWWHHVETGRPDGRDTLLFHCPHPPSSFSPAPFWVCVFSLWVCVMRVRVRWQLASHCPIIPAPLTLCILWGFLLMRERVRAWNKRWVRKEMEEHEKRRTGESLERTGVKVEKLNRSEQSCVCFSVFPQWIPPLGAAYLQSTVQERVCHLDLDVCERDDEGWCYCDFVRVHWMRANALWTRIYLLPYIVTEFTNIILRYLYFTIECYFHLMLLYNSVALQFRGRLHFFIPQIHWRYLLLFRLGFYIQTCCIILN